MAEPAHDLDEFAEYANGHDLDEFSGFAQPAAAPKDERGFFERALDAILSGARDLAGGGKYVARGAARGVAEGGTGLAPLDAIAGGLGVLKDPAKRRQLERGVDDAVTLGYGQRLAGRIGRALGDRPDVDLQATEEADTAAAPGYRTAGQIAGSALPGATRAIGSAAGKVAGALLKPIAPVAERAVTKLGQIPYAGAVLAPAAAGAGGAARNLLGYELAAPATAALSAGAAGHRHEAAHEAASNPAGVTLAALTGAVPAAAKEAGRAAQRYVGRAQKAADEWLIRDVVGEERGASTPTARKQLARDAEDVRGVLKKDVKLREAVGAAKHGDKAKREKAQAEVADRLEAAGAPRGELYKQVDAALPGGGVRAGDVVKQLDDAIAARMKTGKGYDAAEARELGRIRDRITQAEDWGAERSVALDPKLQADIDQLRNVRANMAKRPGFDTSPIDKQIAAIEATGEPVYSFNPDRVVPSVRLRDLVSDAQRTAFEGEGGINGTERYTRASAVAGELKGILDGHLAEAAKKAPEAVKAIAEHNTTTSALLNIDKVLAQRLGTATQKATGASGPAAAAHVAGKLLHGNLPLLAAERLYHGHPGQAAAVLGAAAAPVAKRFVDTQVARATSGPGYDLAVARLARAARAGDNVAAAVQQAINAGVPAAVANDIAEKQQRR